MPKVDNFRIQAHELNKPIIIQRCSKSGVNEDNIYSESGWENILSTRAKIKTEKMDEELMLQGEEDIIIKTFTIRARKDITIKSSDRIIYKNKIYNIKSAEDVQEKGLYIVIKSEYTGLDINNIEDGN